MQADVSPRVQRAGTAAADFGRCTVSDLRTLNVAVCGRPRATSSRDRLISSIQARRVDDTVFVPKAPSAAVFRGLRTTQPQGPAVAVGRAHARPASADARKRKHTSAKASVRQRDPTSVGEMLAIMQADDAPIRTVRRKYGEYANDPVTNVAMWLDECVTMRRRLESHRFLRTLAVALTDAPAGNPRGRRGASSTDVFDEAVEKRRAEWLLNRRVERGYAHVCEVWPGVNRHHVSAGYTGTYVIDNAASLRRKWEAEATDRRLRGRLDRLESTRFSSMRTSSSSAASPATTVDSDTRNGAAAATTMTTRAEDNEMDPEEEAQEIFGGYENDAGMANEEDLPSLHVVVDDACRLHLSLYLAPSQLDDAMARRANDTAASRSALLFRCQAACVGPDRWIVLDTCPWRGKILQFVWERGTTALAADEDEGGANTAAASGKNASGGDDVVAAFVDGFCFSKQRLVPCGSESDPYVCTVCGAVRRQNNLVYADHGGSLRRGKYPCAVCKAPRLHIALDKRTYEARQPWSSKRPRNLISSAPRLNEFPFAR